MNRDADVSRMNRWMFYLVTYTMKVSWHLQHLNEASSRIWLVAFVLVPVGLLIGIFKFGLL